MDPLTLALLIGGGTSLISGFLGSNASQQAANAQTDATTAALGLQREQYNQSRADSMPWLTAGSTALQELLGELTGQGTPASPGTTQGGYGPASGGQSFNSIWEWSQAGSPSDAMVHVNGTSWQPASTLNPYTGGAAVNTPATAALPFQSKFQTTPGYDFAVKEGEKGVVNNLRALGMAGSGAGEKALTRYRMGMADQEYNNYLNRLAALAGVGQSQVQSNASLGANYAANAGQLTQDAGTARASGYAGGANAWMNALGNFGNNSGNWLGAYDQNWRRIAA